MNKPYLPLVVAACLGFAFHTSAHAQEVPAAADEPETILVVGEQPGPGLWRVAKDGHVLWVLGSYGPLPRQMVWRSKTVESLISRSQKLLLPGRANVGTDIGFFKGMTLFPSLVKASRNPNDAKLKDVVPAHTYEKWLTLKQKYLDDDDSVEKLRPTFAANELRSAAMRKSGLTYGTSIESLVKGLARKHKVPVLALPDVTRRTEVDKPRELLKTARDTSFNDAECFATSLNHLEPDIEALKVRANAWARGELESLRTAAGANRTNDCMAQLMAAVQSGSFAPGTSAQGTLERLRTQVDLAQKELKENWIAAAEAALAKNASTFAVLPVSAVLSDTGYLAALRGKGYEVSAPQ